MAVYLLVFLSLLFHRLNEGYTSEGNRAESEILFLLTEGRLKCMYALFGNISPSFFLFFIFLSFRFLSLKGLFRLLK